MFESAVDPDGVLGPATTILSETLSSSVLLALSFRNGSSGISGESK